ILPLAVSQPSRSTLHGRAGALLPSRWRGGIGMTDRALLAGWSLGATLSPLTSEHLGRLRRTRCGRNVPGSMIGGLSVCRLRAGRETLDLLRECAESSRRHVASLEDPVPAVLGFRPHRSLGNLASPLDGRGLCEIPGLVRRSCRVRASRIPSPLLPR